MVEPFTGRGRARTKTPPPIQDRVRHAAALKEKMLAAKDLAEGLRREAGIEVQGAEDGIYLQFESRADVPLEVQSLEDVRCGVEAVNLTVESGEEAGDAVQRATVFVPDGQLALFLGKLERYGSPDPPLQGEHNHRNLFDRIADVRLAALRAFWTDATRPFPADDEECWWEVWLRRTRSGDGRELERLAEFTALQGLRLGERRLHLGDRTITIVRGTAMQLAASVHVLSDLAELRSVRETAAFFVGESPHEQAAWVDDLLLRTTFLLRTPVRVCVLDTGVNRAHPLIAPALDPADLHACDPNWGTHDDRDHGTEMAGLALYGDLAEPLASQAPLVIRHRLESVKILPPPPGANDEKLYASITAEATNRVEVERQPSRRVFSMAITAKSESGDGFPTSWSTAIDALAAGRSFDMGTKGLEYLDEPDSDSRRLFVISAGNVQTEAHGAGTEYLDVCDTTSVEDPAQAWNALTVGAMTERDRIEDADYAGWSTLAPSGDLSPFSATSCTFRKGWPIKPEVMVEGGNLASDGHGNFESDVPELCLLTTARDFQRRLLTTTAATSAATAQVARMAAQVHAEYPNLWPESVRGLIVHSAEWTVAMQTRLTSDLKGDYLNLAKRYGYGVPRLDRALRSAKDALTLISQAVIHPFAKRKAREMHLHELPWPVDALHQLGEAEVRLRVTLSYFIEPHPGRRGYAKRHAYASHGLRFALRRPEESTAEMRARLNKLAVAEEEGRSSKASSDPGWNIGERARWSGSLHSDWWVGTAAALASRGVVAVFPVGGWWKEQPKRDRSEHGARYTLILSILTEAEGVDIWTPVAEQVGLAVDVR